LKRMSEPLSIREYGAGGRINGLAQRTVPKTHRHDTILSRLVKVNITAVFAEG
jgi:hypothetical protein